MIEYNFLRSTSSNVDKCPGIFKFDNTDSKKNYKINKKKKIAMHDISYTLNSQGYRCPEFEKIDWKNSTITLGCSNTFGVGVDDKETYSSKLQGLLDIPVVNLGMVGSSVWHCVYTAKVIAKFEPKYVILQVPNALRFTIFDDDEFNFKNIGPWNTGIVAKMIQYYGQDYNSKVYQDFAVDYISKLLPNGLTYTFTFTGHEEFNKIQELDKARDQMHPGPITHEAVAKKIAKSIFSNAV